MSFHQDPFVTVVSVGIEDKPSSCIPKKSNSEYITVLTIGNEEARSIQDITEEVIVYRLPGERLGFGLKFEGGTKAHEFVKKLFIQSCAPDSPASRVQCSWGQLVEGDEVLEIDSIPVNSMTRIDCVRFLKDSNVAIKLLVKHIFNMKKVKSSEDLPIIVSTEEKKPPPVPPRKLHRKMQKNLETTDIVPTIKQMENFSTKSARLQSPRSSFRKKYSPDVSRRLSDGSIGPPDAEVYLDLFSQESTQSLSESDDTGSTISTVLDRFASFPTTTTSSFAGSLPSTPTSIQKQLDLSYIINEFPDDDFMPILDKKFNRVEENNNLIDGTDEDNARCLEEVNFDDFDDTTKRPVVIPRSSKCKSLDNSTLPRLVDFVPKSPQKDLDASVDTLKRFLESEKFDFDYDNQDGEDVDYDYGTKWLIPSHLSTIGEDEEEHCVQDSSNFGAAALDVTDFGDTIDQESTITENENIPEQLPDEDKQALMEIPPSDSRQPPDGHEFPDFVETVPNRYMERNTSTWSQPVIKPLDRSISNSNYDLRDKMHDSDEEKYVASEKSNLLHTRSQSLIDMSIFSKEKSSSKWNNLVEQRKSRLSKLKGLVIPEAAENDVTPLVNIPEIKSVTSELELPSIDMPVFAKPTAAPVAPIVLPSWSSNATLPKYSPAFKRKSLQVYPINNVKKSDNSPENSFDEYMNKYTDSTPTRTTDDPKSLESIASPTRSDCSFDYNSLKARDNNVTKDFADSDNDSAVSSSQSSYISRSSPPPSPINGQLNGQNRMLKPSSIEAINRKNILASAKCCSGKDTRIGSPVLEIKTTVEQSKAEVKKPVIVTEEIHVNNSTFEEPPIVKNEHQRKFIAPQERPVRTEGYSEVTTTTNKFIIEKAEEKPTPTRRTFTPSIQSRTFDKITTRTSVLDKKNIPVNVQSLRANFENSSNQSVPVFPKSYKSKSPPELANGKSAVINRRFSEDLTKRKTEEKPFLRQVSHEEKPKVESRRFSSGAVTSSVKEEAVKISKATRKEVKSTTAVFAEVSNATTPMVEMTTVVLDLDKSGTPLGITLSGGEDDSKNIMIHRIKYGSIAYQDGQLKKGDKVVSINGQSTVGLTHAAASELLKVSSRSFTIVVEEPKDYLPSTLSKRISSVSSLNSLASDSKGNELDSLTLDKKPTHTVRLIKEEGGLGFSIEGGKDSPKGDVPLVIRKIFTGGAAEKCGELQVGDEILSINKINFNLMTRIEAWNQMKKIAEGEVTIEIFR